MNITCPADAVSYAQAKPFPSSQTPFAISNENVIANYEITSNCLDKLQQLLIFGSRREAAIYALDNKLYAHALVISSCVDKELWSQSVKELMRAELNGDGRESLRVAYSLFAGQGAHSG